jgi:glycosyltransferase involved in cell wall biosynthesis
MEEDPRLGVSCLCLTYGRPHLLEEAIKSFLLQDWDGPKELIVLNDHVQQELVFEHPEVLVVNLKRRLRSQGEKRNLSVALARYDNLLVWDDDDIFLPWRISETMKRLPSDQFFKCPNAWVMNNGVMNNGVITEFGFNLFHSSSAYTRWLFEKANGYRPITQGEDADIEGRFKALGHRQDTILPRERVYYIYRWAHGSYHGTGRELKDINPIIQPGTVVLRPHWRQDYAEAARKVALA